mmetsp:Transcript_88416/g.258423  ORF Transcript_88416/g.258423 Transcript_88416/m.258423 type:complete len:270 (-) Transcript_88416:32-841(-)
MMTPPSRPHRVLAKIMPAMAQPPRATPTAAYARFPSTATKAMKMTAVLYECRDQYSSKGKLMIEPSAYDPMARPLRKVFPPASSMVLSLPGNTIEKFTESMTLPEAMKAQISGGTSRSTSVLLCAAGGPVSASLSRASLLPSSSQVTREQAARTISATKGMVSSTATLRPECGCWQSGRTADLMGTLRSRTSRTVWRTQSSSLPRSCGASQTSKGSSSKLRLVGLQPTPSAAVRREVAEKIRAASRPREVVVIVVDSPCACRGALQEWR